MPNTRRTVAKGRTMKTEKAGTPSRRTRLKARSEAGERARGRKVGQNERSLMQDKKRPRSTVGRTGPRNITKTADDTPRPRPAGAGRKRLAEKARARKTQAARTRTGKALGAREAVASIRAAASSERKAGSGLRRTRREPGEGRKRVRR